MLQKLLEGVKKKVWPPIKFNSIRKDPTSTLQIRIKLKDMNLVLNHRDSPQGIRSLGYEVQFEVVHTNLNFKLNLELYHKDVPRGNSIC